MNANVGPLDQNIRYLLGLVVLTLGVAYQSLWGFVGILVIFTALISWCPPYALFGFSTNKPKS